MRFAATPRSHEPRSHAASASRSRRCRWPCRPCSTHGLVREAEPDGDGPSYGAVFFEPVPDAAYVLGLDVGARFVRGALCDLTGDVRARQDVELPERTAAAALAAIASLAETLVSAHDARRTRSSTASSSACQEQLPTATSRSPANVTGLEGDTFARELEQRLGLPSRSRTTSTFRRSASNGAESREVSTTSSSCRSAPGSEQGSSCAASCTEV